MPYKRTTFKSALSYEGKILSSYKFQIDTHSKLLNTIKSSLPETLASHALYCVVSDQKVSLYTDSAIWSSQLRFYQQSILQNLSNSYQSIFQSLQIKIIPKTTENNKQIDKTLPSTENIDLIMQQAELQNDDELKTALLRLGKTCKKLKKI